MQVGWRKPGPIRISFLLFPAPFSSHPLPAHSAQHHVLVMVPSTIPSTSFPCSLHVLPDFWGSSDPNKGMLVKLLVLLFLPALPGASRASSAAGKSWSSLSPPQHWTGSDQMDPGVGGSQDSSAGIINSLGLAAHVWSQTGTNFHM